MKKLFSAIFCLILLGSFSALAQEPSGFIDQCVSMAGEDATYLKDFVVKLPNGSKENPPVVKHSIVLRKNTVYRFTICNGEHSEGEAILKLFDNDRMQATNYVAKTGKIYQSINFNCSKTGPYTIFISFKDGKSGNAVGIMSYVKRD